MARPRPTALARALRRSAPWLGLVALLAAPAQAAVARAATPQDGAPPQDAPGEDPVDDPVEAPTDDPQDDPGPDRPVVIVPGVGKPLLASDGQPIAPGRVPADTGEVARDRWGRFERSTWLADEAPEPLRSFLIAFDLSFVERENGPRKDENIRFWFLEQGRGYVKSIFEKSKRVSVRGPDGDWLLDGDELVDLSDHSNVESRREHERWLAVARNFASLASPGAVSLVSLRAVELGAALDADPYTLRLSTDDLLSLPDAKLVALARGLEWVVADSPDFALQIEEDRAPGQRVYRALLGLDPASGEVRLTRLVELVAGTPRRQHAMLVHTPAWVEVDGRRVPQQMLIYRRHPEHPGRYETRANVDLWLVPSRTRLNAPLRPDDFLPR